jgi:hypothetical protein
VTLALDTLFAGGRVPAWLRAFDADPPSALHDLLLDRADLGHLTVADPVQILLGWLRAFGERGGLSGQLDAALGVWIDTHWGRLELPSGGNGATLTTLAWVRVTDILSAAPQLSSSGARLTARVLDDRRYLNSLTEGRSRDPQAGAWRALAAHQRDRSLLAHWWGLCDLPPNEPWYRGHCGIAGLRGLPPESQARAGGFPKQVAEGINRLGLALRRLKDEGWLDPELAQEEFEDTLRLLLGAYPFRDRWVQFWRHAQRRDARHGDIGPWIAALLPEAAKIPQRKPGQRQLWADWDPSWPARAKAIAGSLEGGDTAALDAAKTLLAEQRCYFDESGDGSGLVQSATNFSRAIRPLQPEQALEWARLAKSVEPGNGYGWTNEAQSLLALGRSVEALRLYRETVGRFPDNVVARTGLAEVLKAQVQLRRPSWSTGKRASASRTM